MEWVGVQGNALPRMGNYSSESKDRLIQGRPGSFEYLLAIRPEQSISSKIEEERVCFMQHFPGSKRIADHPLIKVAAFSAKESMEDTIIRWMQRICRQVKSFSITLNNYSGIPNHTIYLRIPDQTALAGLAKELRVIDEYLVSHQCTALEWVKKPHLSIASHLAGSIFEKAMLYCSQQLFYECFDVKELVLLRRNRGDETNRLVNVFGLIPAELDLIN